MFKSIQVDGMISPVCASKCADYGLATSKSLHDERWFQRKSSQLPLLYALAKAYNKVLFPVPFSPVNIIISALSGRLLG